MSRLSTRNAWLKVFRNPGCSDATRTKALRSLQPPAGIGLLRKLLADKTTPPKLLVAATELYTEAMGRQKRHKAEPEQLKLPERKRLTAEQIKDLLG